MHYLRHVAEAIAAAVGSYDRPILQKKQSLPKKNKLTKKNRTMMPPPIGQRKFAGARWSMLSAASM
jgi:hypothetical protein